MALSGLLIKRIAKSLIQISARHFFQRSCFWRVVSAILSSPSVILRFGQKTALGDSPDIDSVSSLETKYGQVTYCQGDLAIDETVVFQKTPSDVCRMDVL